MSSSTHPLLGLCVGTNGDTGLWPSGAPATRRDSCCAFCCGYVAEGPWAACGSSGGDSDGGAVNMGPSSASRPCCHGGRAGAAGPPWVPLTPLWAQCWCGWRLV